MSNTDEENATCLEKQENHYPSSDSIPSGSGSEYYSEAEFSGSDSEPNSETETRPRKKRKLINNACQLSEEEAMKHMQYKLSSWKIVYCEQGCQHYARHPDVAGDVLDFDLLPEYVSICLRKNENGCKHRCMHMQIKLANLLIINCRELRHIHFNSALVMDEIKDDPASVLRCLVKNCSNECYHMISAEGIKRCQRKCKSFHEISELGKGTFGTVWKARTPPTQLFHKEHPFVAMKRIKDDHDSDTKKEVEMMMEIQHKNIVKYLISFSDDSTNTVCIIMEYCGKFNLKDIFQRKKFLDLKSFTNEKNVCLMIRILASALHYIHQQGIIHRDIKPANILCDIDDQRDEFDLKLVDFGLAKVMENKTQSGRLYAKTYCGTPIYMSPEVLKNQRYGSPTDIWSFGAVISFICNEGKDLFTEKTDVISWDGGIIVDRKRYSIYLQKIVGDMLNPDEDMRPNAEQIGRNTKNLIDILADAQSKARAKP